MKETGGEKISPRVCWSASTVGSRKKASATPKGKRSHWPKTLLKYSNFYFISAGIIITFLYCPSLHSSRKETQILNHSISRLEERTYIWGLKDVGTERNFLWVCIITDGGLWDRRCVAIDKQNFYYPCRSAGKHTRGNSSSQRIRNSRFFSLRLFSLFLC